ncbi:MAG: DUF2059 domain-containing protein [Flavobacteriales bacterium]
MRHLFLTVFLSLIFVSCKNEKAEQVSKEADTDHNYPSLTFEYLDKNGTYKQYSDAFDEMLYVLKNQVDVSSLPKNYINNLKKDKKKEVDDIINRLVLIYDNYFSKDEIEKMLEFYNSEVGRQLAQDPSLLTTEQKKEVTLFYKSELMVGVSKKHDSLTKDVARVSEEWSRDLYLGILAMIEAEVEEQKN